MAPAGDAHHEPDDHAEDHRQPAPQSLVLERALRELLVEKGVFTDADVARQIDNIDARNPALGAMIVAKAWTEPGFKQWLLDDGTAAVESLGLDMTGQPELVVLENTADRHHVAVCTLCSCYPRAVLGVPPAWYKGREYRSRVVADPRGVLAEFGTHLPDGVDIRVIDSTADRRFLMLPLRPEGTEGWSAERLAELVTRNSMIGTGLARDPAELAAASDT